MVEGSVVVDIDRMLCCTSLREDSLQLYKSGLSMPNPFSAHEVLIHADHPRRFWEYVVLQRTSACTLIDGGCRRLKGRFQRLGTPKTVWTARLHLHRAGSVSVKATKHRTLSIRFATVDREAYCSDVVDKECV